MGSQQTAEILLDTPDVCVESAEDGGSTSDVSLNGIMFHEGLNANAWGLTEDGATSIASSIEGADLTAGHPPVKGNGFTRSIHDGPGMPIGKVSSASVIQVDGAQMADVGGGYTASYDADVTDSMYASKFSEGLMIGGDYGVSIGMNADEKKAVCSVCASNFAECNHTRGASVNGDIAGPLYDDGTADHLAVVYVPAYENANSQVDATSGSETNTMFASAEEFFGERHDTHEAIAKGEYVSWGASQGRVTDRKTSGCFNERIDGDVEVCASEDDPVLLIEVYTDTTDGWVPDDTTVAHKESTCSEWSPDETAKRANDMLLKAMKMGNLREGDLAQWEVMPELFGMIDHIDMDRFVAMVGIHRMDDGNLMRTGYTTTAGFGDLVEFNPNEDDDQSMDENNENASNDELLVEAQKLPDKRVAFEQEPNVEFNLETRYKQ